MDNPRMLDSQLGAAYARGVVLGEVGRAWKGRHIQVS